MQKVHILLILLWLGCGEALFAQPGYTANTKVKPYKEPFAYGTNMGYYSNWKDEQIADIAIGNPLVGQPGVGVTALRPGMFEHFVEQWGYDIRVNAFQHYSTLGSSENVLFLGYPSEEHREQTYHCPTRKSEVFKNLYADIWDDGANGTPVNDNNYYALYVYKVVQRYKNHVRFWEVWNEPDYSYSWASEAPRGEAGNWWENNPNPCDYALHAPVFYYIRMLRISYEIIKTLDPDAYVAVGGLGYPSFLDVILRNTDNPDRGLVTDKYPLKGGAYFDVLSFHSYPHIDGSMRAWDNNARGFKYFRHSDAAVKGVIRLRNEFEEVLEKHGYGGTPYPQKEWIITEINIPRKKMGNFIGSDEAQCNFIIKSLVEVQKYDIRQSHIYQVGDRENFENATNEFTVMGLFKNLNQAAIYEQEPNAVAIAYKTTSDLLRNKRYDKTLTNKLHLPEGVNGGVFRGEDDKEVYVLWAETHTDNSEQAEKEISLIDKINVSHMIAKKWNFAKTRDSAYISTKLIRLTGDPIFLEPVSKFTSIPAGTSPFSGNTSGLRYFPNPVRSDMTIQVDLEEADEVYVEIVNDLGQVVQEVVKGQRLDGGQHQWQINCQNWLTGRYHIRYRTAKQPIVQRVQVVKAGL